MPEITVAEFAARRGLTPQAIRAALKAGKLKGRLMGKTYILDEDQPYVKMESRAHRTGHRKVRST